MDAASIEWFGKLAYMSFLLGPDAPKKAKNWDLPLDEALEGAMDYLTRKELHPSILRDDDTASADDARGT